MGGVTHKKNFHNENFLIYGKCFSHHKAGRSSWFVDVMMISKYCPGVQQSHDGNWRSRRPCSYITISWVYICEWTSESLPVIHRVQSFIWVTSQAIQVSVKGLSSRVSGERACNVDGEIHVVTNNRFLTSLLSCQQKVYCGSRSPLNQVRTNMPVLACSLNVCAIFSNNMDFAVYVYTMTVKCPLTAYSAQ